MLSERHLLCDPQDWNQDSAVCACVCVTWLKCCSSDLASKTVFSILVAGLIDFFFDVLVDKLVLSIF